MYGMLYGKGCLLSNNSFILLSTLGLTPHVYVLYGLWMQTPRNQKRLRVLDCPHSLNHRAHNGKPPPSLAHGP